MRRTLLITAAVPLLLLVGGGGAVASAAPAPAPMTDPSPSDDPEERVRQFVDCLRDNGVDLPDPAGPDRLVPITIGAEEAEALDDALDACEDYAPVPGHPVDLDPAVRPQIEEFRDCLREHGVDLHEPVTVTGHVAESGDAAPGDPIRVATPAPGLAAAPDACADLLHLPTS